VESSPPLYVPRESLDDMTRDRSDKFTPGLVKQMRIKIMVDKQRNPPANDAIYTTIKFFALIELQVVNFESTNNFASLAWVQSITIIKWGCFGSNNSKSKQSLHNYLMFSINRMSHSYLQGLQQTQT
jgi:hypothetical protein